MGWRGGKQSAIIVTVRKIRGSLGVWNFVVTSLGMKLSCKEKKELIIGLGLAHTHWLSDYYPNPNHSAEPWQVRYCSLYVINIINAVLLLLVLTCQPPPFGFTGLGWNLELWSGVPQLQIKTSF